MRTFTGLALVALLMSTMVGSASAGGLQASHLAPIVASPVGLQHSQSVGVLYSDNTLDNLEYLARYHAMAVNGAKGQLDEQIRQAFVDSSDPDLAIDWLMASLRHTFASVTRYDNLDALLQAHPDVVVMLDTYSRLVSKRNNQVEARFMASFYDSNLQYIGKAEGSRTQQMPSVWVHGKAAPEIAAQINQQIALQENALKQFDTSLKALVATGRVAQVAIN